jgi:hypothetical protein
MLGPNEGVYVVIQERAYCLIVRRQEELDEPSIIGDGAIANPKEVILRLACFRENGYDDTRLG